MPGSDELYPPAQYEPSWIAWAIVIILVLIVAGWLLVWFTRPRKAIEASKDNVLLSTQDIFGQLRYEYFSRIDQIEAAFKAGDADARDTSLALSRAVREFVNEYSGLEAPVMTLEDLHRQGVYPPLLEAISLHYRATFLRQPHIDPNASVRAARTVVNTWH
jgi:hypothetical protein